MKHSLALGLILVTGTASLVSVASQHPKPKQKPALGAVAVPVDFLIKVGNDTYRFTAPSITFTPAGTEARRSLSGTGTFTLVAPQPNPGPAPVPVPVPVPVPNPTPTPAPVPVPVPPGGVVNVRSFGAKGDGVTDDTAAMQHAISSAKAGDTVYWPAGTYLQKDQLKMNHVPAITLMGDGPTSVLHAAAGMNFYVGTGGESGGPVTIKNLKFVGTAGATMRSSLLPTGGIQIFGPTNTTVDNCDFENVMSAVYDAAPTTGTTVKNCRINGWARIAFFVERDGQILNCKIIQNDPHPEQEATSHGIYIHGAASNVLVADCEISGVAKYAIQQYSEAPNTVTNNVKLLRLNIHDCRNGLVFAHSQQGAGDIKNSVIDACTIRNTTGGSAVLIKDGDGVTISNNLIDGCISYGIGVGGWAPYEQGFSLSNVDIFGNTVRNCQVGLFGLASNGGVFSNVRFHDNAVTGNRQNVSVEKVLGISYTP